MDGAERSDEELARQVGGGNDDAFADLYRRYLPRLYDFALRISRDRGIAALVVQSAFLRAYHSLRASSLDTPFRVQLFAGAHFDLAERLRSRRGPGDEPEEAFAAADAALAASPALATDLPELARVTWRAVAAMRLDEYELLDFAVRQRLDSAEIAAILRTRPEAIERKLASVEAQLEESVSAQLVLARGRQACLDLDFLAGDEAWSPSLERRIGRHVRSCLTCQGLRQRYPGGLALLASLALAPAPEGWQATILTRLQEAVRSGAQAPEPVAVRSIPARREPQTLSAGGAGFGDWAGGIVSGAGSRGPLVAVLGGAVLVVAIAFVALCSAGTFDGGGSSNGPTPTVTETGTRTATRTITPTGTGTITLTPPPLPTSTPEPPTPTEAPPTEVSATPVPTNTPFVPRPSATDTPVP